MLRSDQALALAEKPSFWNCLVAMRPKTMRKDLPTRHNIEIYIHNEFMDWLKTLKSEILVSSLFLQVICTHFYTQKAPSRILLAIDGWTADNMKASFLGMIVSWIEVKGGKWKLHSKVVGF